MSYESSWCGKSPSRTRKEVCQIGLWLRSAWEHLRLEDWVCSCESSVRIASRSPCLVIDLATASLNMIGSSIKLVLRIVMASFSLKYLLTTMIYEERFLSTLIGLRMWSNRN